VPETIDGYLTTGEYANLSVKIEGYEALTVNGGGAHWIEARDFGSLEVQYTSIPTKYPDGRDNWNTGGIMDIVLFDYTELLYLDGITQEIEVRDNATAILRGGRIDFLSILRWPGGYTSSVTIYCQENYTLWENGGGITGYWADGNKFDIKFLNIGTLPPTANFVNIEIIPEPASLVLLGLGGLLLRRKCS